MEDFKDWIDPGSAEMLLKFVAKSLHARAGNASIHENQGIAAPPGKPTSTPHDPEARYQHSCRPRCGAFA
jgi:hypothetical protein